ncbi:hypothetical protein L7F22_058752 [Adiantum nelumboides]|nr:hypothetical protein [Adiantum nelumboides]
MSHECHYHRKKQRQKAAWAICLIVTILLIILLLILYFAVFKPRDPTVRVPLMQMAYYSTAGTPPSITTISFGLNLQVAIYNPNRGTFHMEDSSSSASLYYGNAQLALSLLPNNTHIPSQSSFFYGISLAMQRPILVNLTGPYSTPTLFTLPTSSIVTVFGHVTTAGSFTHHSRVASICNITIGLSTSSASILSFSCKNSYSLGD